MTQAETSLLHKSGTQGWYYCLKVFFRATQDHRTVIISISTATNQVPAYTATPRIWNKCFAWCVYPAGFH